MTPEASKWWKRSPWFEIDGYERETAMARGIDKQLTAEGLNQNDPEYFEQLDDRLQNYFPDLYNGQAVEEQEKAPRPRNNAAPANRQGRGGKSKGRKVLPKSQLALAAELGLTTTEELEALADEYAKGEGV